MLGANREAARLLEQHKSTLAEAVIQRHILLQPEIRSRYGTRGREKCLADTSYHLAYLAEAIAAGQPNLFQDYISWAKTMLASRGVPAEDLRVHLQALLDVIRRELPKESADIIGQFVSHALERFSDITNALTPAAAPTDTLAQLADRYVFVLLESDRQAAMQMVMEAVEDGTPLQDLYLGVFQRAQHEIGRLWQMNEISVAQEHFCSAATQVIMSRLHPMLSATRRKGRSFVGACVQGEYHEMGIRMICDLLELDGWDTIYLGANMPAPDLVNILAERRADVVGISASITFNVSTVMQMIDLIRADARCKSVRVAVGGHPFNLAPELHKTVGADGTAPDAKAAIDLVNAFVC